MQRRGLKLPLLIGGATTSRQHTAVRIAPAYDGTTVHVLDASRVVGVVSDLLDADRAERAATSATGPSRSACASSTPSRHARPLLTLAQARANREQVVLRRPAGAGVHRRARPSSRTWPTLREIIDWQFFFLAWELKGKYPAILDQPVARELFDDGNALLDEIIADGSLRGPGRVRLLAGARRGRRHRPRRRATADVRFPMLRQQTEKPAGRANRCLADYVAPAGDHLGGFAVAIHGAEELAASTRPSNDDYRAIMVKALADRLAEAFAEYIHLQARRAWFEPDADPALEDLHAERFRGIRPALGLPGQPGPQPEAGAVRPARRRASWAWP